MALRQTIFDNRFFIEGDESLVATESSFLLVAASLHGNR